MTFELDFYDLMPHTIFHTTYKSLDGYGKASYSTANSSYTGRVTYTNKLVRDASGQEVVSSAQVILATTSTINPDDKLTLPTGESPIILKVNVISDTGGTHHQKVYFA